MKHTLLASALLAGLGLGVSTLPSAALPMNVSGIAASDGSDLVQVRMSRREMRRHRMTRQHRMRQGSASRGKRQHALAQSVWWAAVRRNVWRSASLISP